MTLTGICPDPVVRVVTLLELTTSCCCGIGAPHDWHIVADIGQSESAASRSSTRSYALAMLTCSVICFNTLQQPPW